MKNQAGSGQDYPGYDGLAHFTEHSIFSGSKHYKSPGMSNECNYKAFLTF